MGSLVWRVLGTGSAILAGTAARNGIKKVWQLATGKEPPANPVSPRVSTVEAVGWSLASGAIIQLARMLATRQAAKYYEKSAGHLPAKLEETA